MISRNGVALAGVWLAIAFWLHAPIAAVAGSDAIAFELTDGALLTGIAYAEFAPGTRERGPIENQTPLLRLPITGLELKIASGGDTDCGDGAEADAALGSSNVDAITPARSGDCLLLAQLTFTSDRKFKIVGECNDWRKDVSYCWVDGDLGQFWLRRKGATGRQLEVILGPFEPAAEPRTGALSLASTAIQPLGLMLDSPLDDAGRAVSDRWILLPPRVVTLPLTR